MSHVDEQELVMHALGDSGDAAAVGRHLEQCEEGRGRLAEIERVLAATTGLEVPEPDAGFEARIWARQRAALHATGGPLAPGGLNGIDYHPDGYLLVAQTRTSGLVKVPLDDALATSSVELAEPIRADGLILMPSGDLIAVAGTEGEEGPRSEVLRLTSDDGWATANIAARWMAAPNATTAAVRGDEVYVVDARFDDMMSGAPHFDITRVQFP